MKTFTLSFILPLLFATAIILANWLPCHLDKECFIVENGVRFHP